MARRMGVYCNGTETKRKKEEKTMQSIRRITRNITTAIWPYLSAIRLIFSMPHLLLVASIWNRYGPRSPMISIVPKPAHVRCGKFFLDEVSIKMIPIAVCLIWDGDVETAIFIYLHFKLYIMRIHGKCLACFFMHTYTGIILRWSRSPFLQNIIVLYISFLHCQKWLDFTFRYLFS